MSTAKPSPPVANPALNAPMDVVVEPEGAVCLARTDLGVLARGVATSLDPKGLRVRIIGLGLVVPVQANALRAALTQVLSTAVQTNQTDEPVQLEIRHEGLDVDFVVRGERDVRIRVPRMEPGTTMLVIGDPASNVISAVDEVGLLPLTCESVTEALELTWELPAMRAALILRGAWAAARSRDVLALRCALLPAPVLSEGPPPEAVASLIDEILPTPFGSAALTHALPEPS